MDDTQPRQAGDDDVLRYTQSGVNDVQVVDSNGVVPGCRSELYHVPTCTDQKAFALKSLKRVGM